MSSKGFKIIKDINKPETELVEKFRDYPVANIADNLGRFDCMEWQIKPINEKDNIKLLGTAITVKTRVADNLMVHKAIDLADEGDIIIVDAQGNVNNAIIGEIMCIYAAQKGIKGFVIDGLIRDIEYIKKMENFIVYARGSSPKGPYKNGPGEINTQISCGGIVVNPGDIIIGDNDGVVAVNPFEAEDIAKNTKISNKKEKEKIKKIENGLINRDWIDEKIRRSNL